jgi:hypothetical protein
MVLSVKRHRDPAGLLRAIAAVMRCAPKEHFTPMPWFPMVDPIPLPAPVWLFKLLHIVTLALHFLTVELLLGGLLLATVISGWARSGPGRTAAAGLARRMPILMTYVINFGVPPLLFAQVLYGRGIYTSSVLIGMWWIAVIPLLMLCYWLLYRFAARLEAGKTGWWLGGLAWLVAAAIAKIYTANMTLMLRPEAWPGMFEATAAGVLLPTGDPTFFARWVFMLAGGLVAGGLWMIYLSGRSTFTAEEQGTLGSIGGKVAAVAALVWVAAGWRALALQPSAVPVGLEQPLYAISSWAWLAVAAIILLLGATAGFSAMRNQLMSWGAAVVLFLGMATLTVVRDGVRDLTLLSKGYDVWDRVVVTNWGVVGLFLLLFVVGLGAAGWLISVAARARKIPETVAAPAAAAARATGGVA